MSLYPVAYFSSPSLTPADAPAVDIGLSISKMVKKTTERDAPDAGKLGTLGSLRLRHHQTNEIILVPTPSNDPNDPLNW